MSLYFYSRQHRPSAPSSYPSTLSSPFSSTSSSSTFIFLLDLFDIHVMCFAQVVPVDAVKVQVYVRHRCIAWLYARLSSSTPRRRRRNRDHDQESDSQVRAVQIVAAQVVASKLLTHTLVPLLTLFDLLFMLNAALRHSDCFAYRFCLYMIL